MYDVSYIAKPIMIFGKKIVYFLKKQFNYFNIRHLSDSFGSTPRMTEPCGMNLIV